MKRVNRDILRRLFLLASLTMPGAAIAQSKQSDSTAKRLAISIRSSAGAEEAEGVLTQKAGRRGAAEVDAVADSLMVMALSGTLVKQGLALRNGDPNTFQHSPTFALRVAGAGLDGGTPYKGAAQRLASIAANARDLTTRTEAVSAFPDLPDRAESIAILTRIAAMPHNDVSYLALGLLNQPPLAAAGGLVALQDLFRRKAVTEPDAQVVMMDIAQAHGWKN